MHVLLYSEICKFMRPWLTTIVLAVCASQMLLGVSGVVSEALKDLNLIRHFISFYNLQPGVWSQL